MVVLDCPETDSETCEMSYKASGVTPGRIKLTSSTQVHNLTSNFIPDEFNTKCETDQYCFIVAINIPY